MLYMLDTDICSYIIRGRSESVESKLSAIEPSDLCVSAITRGELMYGLKRLTPGHKLHLVVRQFFKIFRVAAWDGEAADFYADIRHQLTTTGQPVGELDMMIAAHSLAVAAVLVTNNIQHFQRIAAPLMLQNWTVTG